MSPGHSFSTGKEPKVGKTTLAGSFPHSIIVACPINEATSLASLPNAKDIVVLGTKTWEDVNDAVDMVIKKPRETGVFETIVVDNITPAYSLCVQYTLDKQTRKVISEATWTAANRDMMDLLNRLLAVKDKNIVLVAHNRREKADEKSGSSARIFPDFGEALARRIVGAMNALFYYRLKESGKRELVTSMIPGIDVGSRYELPRSLTDPTANDILIQLDAYRQKVKTLHGIQ
jgi:hypothetical protein